MRVVRAGSVLVLTFALMAATGAWAQEGAESGHRAHGQGMMMATPEQHAEHLGEMLNLSEDQKAKVQSIFQDQQKQMSDLKADTSLS